MAKQEYEMMIGLEVHVELATRTKMFCRCSSKFGDPPNTHVCPVCLGLPGALPVPNEEAIRLAVRAALALNCTVHKSSKFDRKNYFYPDLPKGYQISQYDQPLGINGQLAIKTSRGDRVICIRRVHLEEDTGKLTHVERAGIAEAQPHTLLDLNRAGVPLLEIVTEPDIQTAEEARQYAIALRTILRYVGASSGDMQKGALRVEPNISLRPAGTEKLGIRTEIKNLNSFRALERSIDYEIDRQTRLLMQEQGVQQETRGWDEARGSTYSQRSKEEAEDYRYFPEPDLPPLAAPADWVTAIRQSLPELPAEKQQRFIEQHGLSGYDAGVLTVEPAVAQFFEATVQAATPVPAKSVANWITGDLFGMMNQVGIGIEDLRLTPANLGELVRMVSGGQINQATGKSVLAEMISSGQPAAEIVAQKGLGQISDAGTIADLVKQVLDQNPEQVASYLAGKETVARWLFGQVMRAAQGRANPTVIQQELERELRKM